MNLDIFLVGVGGQGILTIGEIVAEAALRQGLPVNFYPSKGMAQRGGFVKAQLRLGRSEVGPNIPERGSDLVIAMEVSEALKAVRYVRPGGHFVLYGDIWAPTAVMLGKAPYPSVDAVRDEVCAAGAHLRYVDPCALPSYQGKPVADNVFLLGVVMANTRLTRIIEGAHMRSAIVQRWPKGAERNLYAYEQGLAMANSPSCITKEGAR